MANALPVSHCRRCQVSLADNGDQPNVVKCARGHPFHRNCLITPDICVRCPENQCGEQFTFVSKGLADRSAEILMDVIGWIDLYNLDLTNIVEAHGVTYEYASAIKTETDFLKELLMPENIYRALLSPECLMVVGLTVFHCSFPFVVDYFQRQYYAESSSEQQEPAVVPLEQ